jgi:serine protease Do
MSNDYFNNQNNEIVNECGYKNDKENIETKITVHEIESKKRPKFTNRFLWLIFSAVLFGVVAGVVFQGYNSIVNKKQDNTLIIGENIDETDVASGESNELKNVEYDKDDGDNVETIETGIVKNDVSTVVDNVMPAIVAINSVVTEVSRDIFGGRYEEQMEGSGSGIIIGQNDSEILIVTNNHVIEGANAVEIVFADDTTANATIKGTATYTDLAILSVRIDDLLEGTIDHIKIATLGDSNSLRLGEMSIAIGNALGYGQSITVGYISALHREVTIDGITLNVLQTDAAINPGNSGGALLNSQGEVIGINSVKYVDDNVESIGYAIPISDAIPIINDLMNRTILADNEKAYLGISGKDVTQAYSQSFNMPVGVYVGKIVSGSAAAEAGIQVGDIITAINEIKVETMTDLQETLSYIKAGTTGTITIMSLENGKYTEKVLNVTFNERP